MIFVTVGTHQQPFPRLLDAVVNLGTNDVFVQYGHSASPRGVREAVQFLAFEDVLRHMRETDVVVTHAGVGSILLARRVGHTPIVVPRRRRHGEHVDDHQVELTEALARQQAVVPVWNVAELGEALASVPARAEPRDVAVTSIHHAVRSALER